MKLKVKKNHYYDGKYRVIGEIYITDVKFGTSAVKNGLCTEINYITLEQKKMEVETKKKLKNLKKRKTKK